MGSIPVHPYLRKPPIGSLLLDSCFTETGFVLSLRPKPEPSSPQADTVELTARFLKLMAAFTSRSWFAPHFGQTHSRTTKGKASSLCPQPEHVLLLGYQRSATTIIAPRCAALYSNCRRNSKKPMSDTARDKCRFLTMPRTFKSSMPMV